MSAEMRNICENTQVMLFIRNICKLHTFYVVYRIFVFYPKLRNGSGLYPGILQHSVNFH